VIIEGFESWVGVSLANHTTDQKTPHNGEFSNQRSDDKNPKYSQGNKQCIKMQEYMSIHLSAYNSN
jgi:hypothetical protein